MNEKPSVAVTGANGYLGRHLCAALVARGCMTIPVVRDAESASADMFPGCEPPRGCGDLAGDPPWDTLLRDISVVVHTAGIAHRRSAGRRDMSSIAKVNTSATLALASAARGMLVRRFVHISSIGVYGERSDGVPLVESMTCRPVESYATSKLEAERGLRSAASSGDMETVVLRPPMIYGPRSPGNLRSLAGLVKTGVPLPFADLDGRRNLVGIGALCDAIATVVVDDGDARGTWNVADADGIDLVGIVQALAEGVRGERARLFSCPRFLLLAGATAFGRRALIEKLDRVVLVDSSSFRERFGWTSSDLPHGGIVETGRSWKHR